MLAHNQAGIVALQLNEAAEVKHGFSHVIVESQSIGLLLRYIISNYSSVKLDFADSISLSENGCLDELYFQQLYGHNSQESEGNMSSRSLSNLRDEQERISQVLFSMNTRGLISSRSDVIALLSGELLQLRVEKSYLFQTSYHWEPHYFLLTSIGILKFKGADMVSAPDFVPLRSMVKTDIIDDEQSKYTTQKFLQITFIESETSSNLEKEMILTSENVGQVIEWTEMIKRLRLLYTESKSAMEAIGAHSNGKSLFDNTTQLGPISP